MDQLTRAGKDKIGTVEEVKARSRGAGAGLAARSMPESLAAEAAVLGSMIIDPECISEVVEQVKTDAFYRIEHRYLFDAIIALYEKNPFEKLTDDGKLKGLDLVLIRDELEKRKQLEEVGGVEYLVKVAESVPSSANVNYYAGIIKEKMLLREMIAAASEILDDAYNEAGEPNENLTKRSAGFLPLRIKR